MATEFSLAGDADGFASFMAEPILATLTLTRPDGTPQVTPIGFTYDPVTATGRIITWTGAYKAQLLANDPGQQIAVCHVAGPSWLTFYGSAELRSDEPEIAEAERRYAARYRPPSSRPDRAVITIAVRRIQGALRS